MNPAPMPDTPSEDEQAIAAWLRQRAIPLRHVEAGNGFADLEPLRRVLEGVRVVGLGEATHGTREFFQLKHRLLEFLVAEMGFQALALEASFAACQPIDEFIRHGRGDRATVLTGNGYVAWDTEECSAMLDWLRGRNRGVPEAARVRFFGLDVWRNANGRAAVLDYLRRVAPDRAPGADAVFADLAAEEGKWPWRTDEAALAALLPRLQGIIDDLTADREGCADASSTAACEEVLQYTRVMRQWLISYTASLRPPSRSGASVRSAYIAENLIHLIERAGPDARFVVWAHNAHVSVNPILWSGEPTLGSCLRAQFGRGYYAFGLEFHQGSYLTRTGRPDDRAGDLREATLPPAPAGSVPWHLSRTGLGALLLDLRAPVGDRAVEGWLQTPRATQWAYWNYEQGSHCGELAFGDHYDGIAFVDRTAATRPTANALRSATAGERF